jgi:hypothetical protein
VAPWLQGAMHIPGTTVQRKVSAWLPEYSGILLRFTCHLATTALTAFTCVMFFGLCRRLRVRPVPAGIATMALAFATFIWVYARYPYSEALQLACYTGFFVALLDAAERPNLRRGLMLGLWAGLLVNSKIIYVASIPGVMVWMLWHLRWRWREAGRLLLGAALTGLPLVAALFLYNWVRWGGVLATGYNLSAGVGMRENPLVGLWGMLASPGKSIFLYAPPLIFSLFALRRLFRTSRPVVWIMLLTILPPALVSARFVSWAGDYAWGPRYILFAAAVFMVPAAMVLDDWLDRLRSWRRVWAVAAFAAVTATGVYVTYLGNAIYWDHWIRVQKEAGEKWLGMPNTAGDGTSVPGAPCVVCFEQLYPLHWLPPFNHVIGNQWLLRHNLKDDNWAKAQPDAPWRRYTTLDFDLTGSYNRSRIDWWFVEFRPVFPKLSWGLLIGLPLLAFVCGVFFFRELRRRPGDGGVSHPGSSPVGESENRTENPSPA